MNKRQISITKYIVLLLGISIISFFVNSNKNEKVIKEEVLADINTPKLINQAYNIDHYIVADYIINTSNSDMTSTIQNTLNTCSSNKGGTVWLEKGIYNVNSPITIPSGCTLMGDWQDPDNYQGELNYGTKIVVDVNTFKSDNSEFTTTGLFKLEPGSGIEGLTIYYKNQNINNPINQPWSIIYISSNRGMSLLNTIKNITLINSYRGIGQSLNASAHATLGIENVKGTVLFDGVLIHRSGDVGTINGLSLKTKYWANANLKAFDDNVGNISESIISNKIKSINGRGLTITKVDSTQIVNLDISGYKYGLLIPKNLENDGWASASIYNMNITDCENGIYVESGSVGGLVQLMGYVISNSSIYGSKYAIYNDCDYASSRNFQGTLKLHDVSIKGKVGGKGRTIYYDSSSNNYKIIEKEVDLTGKINNTSKFSNINLNYIYRNKGNNYTYLESGSSVDQINSALSNISSKGGGIVYLKPGKYTINKSIIVPSNVELRGSSISRVHYFDLGTVFNLVSDNNFRVVVLNGDNAGISGISIINKKMIDTLNNSNTYANGDYVIVAEKVKNVYVNNITIAGATFGIYFNQCDGFVVKNVLSSVSHNLIRSDSSKNGLIINTLNNGWVLDMNGLYNTNKGNTMNEITLKTLDYIHINNSSNIKLQNIFAFRSHITIKTNNSTFYGVNVGHDDSIMGNTMYVENTNSNGVLVNTVKFSHCETVHNISGNNVGVYNVISDWNNDNPDIKNNIFKISEEVKPTPTPTPTSVPVINKGDIDGNGKIETMDYILLRKYLLKQNTLDNNQLLRADINSDGKITAIDYVAIRKIIVSS